jgi:hypothetical protein
MTYPFIANAKLCGGPTGTSTLATGSDLHGADPAALFSFDYD